MCNTKENLFISDALPASSLFHIFNKKDNRSLCGNFALIFTDDRTADEIKGTEKYKKGQDCKACFKKANLQI